MRPLAVTFGDFLGAIPRAAPYFQSGHGRSLLFEATVRSSCSGSQSRALDAAARFCKGTAFTLIMAIPPSSRRTSSSQYRARSLRADWPRLCAYSSIQLLVWFAALPFRVLGGRRRGPTASVFASEADREGRGSCPTGQAQRSCDLGPWAKASKGDHEVEERYAQVWRCLRVVYTSTLLQRMLRLRCLVLLSSTKGVAFVHPGFWGTHGIHTGYSWCTHGVLKRYSSVWRSCSRAFGAWAFHMRKRRRLRKVRAPGLA
jgi:hypothetical protein